MSLSIASLKEGDYLQHSLHFYRVHNVGKDIVMNQILYNPKTERLQMSHVYKYAEWSEIGDGKFYTMLVGEDPETITKLEWIKRKYKLEKLNNISE